MDSKTQGSNPLKASFVYSRIRGGLGWKREDLLLYKSYMDLILIIPNHSLVFKLMSFETPLDPLLLQKQNLGMHLNKTKRSTPFNKVLNLHTPSENKFINPLPDSPGS
jgi:hypothetical protein